MFNQKLLSSSSCLLPLLSSYIGWHSYKFTCQKPRNHLFIFYLPLLSISSQLSGPLASISLIPFVLYLSTDAHHCCLISGCITSHLDYYFLTTHSFYNLIPVYPISYRKLKLDHVPSILKNFHAFFAGPERKQTPQHGGQASPQSSQSPSTSSVFAVLTELPLMSCA